MPIFELLEDYIQFPDPELADESGILAVGGDLSSERLLLAYEMGIFPWFNPEDPIIWWSPNPRFVLFPEELKIRKSMRPYLNNNRFEVSMDSCFETVMRACQTHYRPGQGGGTWITESMIKGYVRLHEMGYAHSVEVWKDEVLVGGLYGIALGQCFFGESMFARVSNASKYGFIRLVQFLKQNNFKLIDCQQETEHLGSLGAKSIPRTDFLALLNQYTLQKGIAGSWSALKLQ